jgi:hypothetical protein
MVFLSYLPEHLSIDAGWQVAVWSLSVTLRRHYSLLPNKSS